MGGYNSCESTCLIFSAHLASVDFFGECIFCNSRLGTAARAGLVPAPLLLVGWTFLIRIKELPAGVFANMTAYVYV